MPVPGTTIQPARLASRWLAPRRQDTELAGLAKALGHPARIRILRLLARRTHCFYGPLAEELPLAASTVSQHLRILRAAGLVKGDVHGPRTCYCINRERLARATALLRDLAGTRPAGAEPSMTQPACDI
jgi:ArsR family transcriptional regulator, arsenate/arsenite/antimonite-responsive transcriptional repressor